MGLKGKTFGLGCLLLLVGGSYLLFSSTSNKTRKLVHPVFVNVAQPTKQELEQWNEYVEEVAERMKESPQGESQWVRPDKPIPPPPPVADIAAAMRAAESGAQGEWIPPRRDLPPPPPVPDIAGAMREAKNPTKKSVWIKPTKAIPPPPPLPPNPFGDPQNH